MITLKVWCAKVRHTTENRAYCHLRSIVRRNKRAGFHVPGKLLSVYFCGECQAWHCGHHREELKPPAS